MTFCTRFICGSFFSPVFLSHLFLVQFITSLSSFCVFPYFIFYWNIFVSFLVVPYFIIFWYLFVSFLGRVSLFSYGLSFFLFLVVRYFIIFYYLFVSFLGRVSLLRLQRSVRTRQDFLLRHLREI